MGSIGKRIKLYRKLNGFTQEHLGKAAGISTMSMRRYESDERIPNKSTISRIANALGVSPLELQKDGGPTLEKLNSILQEMNPTINHIKDQLENTVKEVMPKFQEILKEAEKLGFSDGVDTEKIITDLLESFDDSWGMLTPWAFIRDLSQTTGDEKRKIWEFIKFLKTQRMDEDTKQDG